MIRSIMDYGAPPWQPWLSKTNVNALERAQNKALGRISGQHVGSPFGSKNLETGIPTYATIINRKCIKKQEKGLRLPPDHPSNIAFAFVTKHRLRRDSCRLKATELTKLLKHDISNRKPITLFPNTRPGRISATLPFTTPFLACPSALMTLFRNGLQQCPG